MLASMWRTWNPCTQCWQKWKIAQAFWKIVWRFLKKLKLELPYNPAILFLGTYPEEMTLGSQTDISTLMFIQTLFTVTKMWKQPKCRWTEKWLKKYMVYTYNGILFGLWKKGNATICDNMEEHWGHYAKWNELVGKNKFCLIPFIWGI